MKIACIICARKNSKGIKNKNFKKINKISLIERTIKQAKKENKFNNILISSDEIKQSLNLSKKYNIDYVKRPSSLAKDNSSKIDAIKHGLLFLENKYQIKYDYIVDLDVTTPLRILKDIRKAINKIIKHKYENLISINKSKKNPYFNMIEIKNNKIAYIKDIKKKYFTRQSSPNVYELNGAIYIWKRNKILNKINYKNLLTRRTGFIELKRFSGIDIDNEIDWLLVEAILKKNEK